MSRVNAAGKILTALSVITLFVTVVVVGVERNSALRRCDEYARGVDTLQNELQDCKNQRNFCFETWSNISEVNEALRAELRALEHRYNELLTWLDESK